MKFEKLKPNKIKITIDNDDLLHWGVSADAVAKNLPETREMFVSLMKQAEEETGFVCSNSRLVIEAAISDEGKNLTLYVTKVDNEEERQLFDKISAVRKPEVIKSGGIAIHHKKKNQMTELETFDDVIELCHALDLYYGGTLYLYNDKYYMVTDNLRANAATEFGRTVSPRTQLLIEEHAKVV